MILVPEVRGLLANRQVLGTLVRRDLRVRYARSVLGYVWSVLDPLAMSLIYFIVFTLIFHARHVGNEPYFLHLLIGLLAWQWFSLCMTETSRALLQESRLVKSTNLPRELWVVRVVMAKGVEFAFSLPVLLAFTLFYVLHGDARLNWTLVFFPAAMALTFILATGVGLILAPITVLVTDMARVVRIALRMGFYATPILYSIHSAPENLRSFLVFNPMSGIMELFRTGFFDTAVNRSAVVIAVVACGLVLVLGVAVFKRFEPAVLKEI